MITVVSVNNNNHNSCCYLKYIANKPRPPVSSSQERVCCKKKNPLHRNRKVNVFQRILGLNKQKYAGEFLLMTGATYLVICGIFEFSCIQIFSLIMDISAE